jgi:hypothetical protein
VNTYASSELANTPAIAPEKAAAPLRVSPATRKMITAESSVTAAKETSSAFQPSRQSGITSFQITRQENTKESSAQIPVNRPNTASSTAKRLNRMTV